MQVVRSSEACIPAGHCVQRAWPTSLEVAAYELAAQGAQANELAPPEEPPAPRRTGLLLFRQWWWWWR